jgi:hypothetical protein
MFKILFLSAWFVFHPVHVTLTSVDFIPETDNFKLFVRMYFDDFLLDSRLYDQAPQKEKFSVEDSASIKFIERYLRDKIVIKVNEKQLQSRLTSLNMADNEVSMNMECNFGKKPKTITVKNLIMTGLYSDQANMVIVRINDFEEGVKLTSEMTEQTFKIK